ncbi:hypothetical protein INR49_008281, partial [Caranx melampygus]
IEPQLSSDWNHNLTSLTAPKSPRYRTVRTVTASSYVSSRCSSTVRVLLLGPQSC